MFCVNCGKELVDAAIICPQCGTPTRNYNPAMNSPAAMQAHGLTPKAEFRTCMYENELPDNLSMSQAMKFKPTYINLHFYDDCIEMQKIETNGQITILKDNGNLRITETIKIPYTDMTVERKEIKVIFSKLNCLVIKSSGRIYTFSADIKQSPAGMIQKFEREKVYYSDLNTLKSIDALLRNKGL